jgi:hypothetical protein
VAAVKRTKQQREIDLARVADLVARGKSQRAIAAELGLSQPIISRDWRECLQRLAASRDVDTALKRAAMLEQYSKVKEEAWAAWDRSKEDRQRETKEQAGSMGAKGGKGASAPVKERFKVQSISEGRLPANEYLRTVLHCLDRECDLEALHPPKKVAPTTPDGESPYEPSSAQLLDRMLAALAAGGAVADD